MANILVVDDEKNVRDMVVKMIKPLGHKLSEAENGLQAIESCRSTAFDLVITDLVMPGKHGIDLIMDLKKEFPNIPVIAISGGGGINGRFDYLEIAKLAGVTKIMKKPFEMSDMRQAVNEIFDHAQ